MTAIFKLKKKLNNCKYKYNKYKNNTQVYKLDSNTNYYVIILIKLVLGYWFSGWFLKENNKLS